MTVTRLTVLPCKSNLRMLVGGGVPSRVQLLLPTHRPANLTVGIRISLPAARRLFLSFSHNNQLSPSHLYLYLPAFDFGHPLSFTKSFSKLQLHSLNQLYLLFFKPLPQFLTPVLHLQHTNHQNALLIGCCCPGWLCLRCIHSSRPRQPDQRWTGSGADFGSIPNFRCSCRGGDGAEHPGSCHHLLCPYNQELPGQLPLNLLRRCGSSRRHLFTSCPSSGCHERCSSCSRCQLPSCSSCSRCQLPSCSSSGRHQRCTSCPSCELPSCSS